MKNQILRNRIGKRLNGEAFRIMMKDTEYMKNRKIATESYRQTIVRRFRKHHLAAFSLGILLFVGLAAVLAPIIAPYDPDAMVGPFSGAPCREFLLGTDQIGRDVFSRLLYCSGIW